MKFKVFFVVLVGLLICSGCRRESKDITGTQLAREENAEIGQLLQIYRADTEYRNPDGSYLIVNFPAINKHLTYKTNNDQIVNNVIVIENVTEISKTRLFVREAAYFVLFSGKGKEIKITKDIWTQSGDEFSEIIIPLNSETDLNACKFILIGGFDKLSNQGRTKLIFNINQTIEE